MIPTVSWDVTVARCVDRAGLHGELQRTEGRRDRWPHEDCASDDDALAAERTERLGAGKGRVVASRKLRCDDLLSHCEGHRTDRKIDDGDERPGAVGQNGCCPDDGFGDAVAVKVGGDRDRDVADVRDTRLGGARDRGPAVRGRGDRVDSRRDKRCGIDLNRSLLRLADVPDGVRLRRRERDEAHRKVCGRGQRPPAIQADRHRVDVDTVLKTVAARIGRHADRERRPRFAGTRDHRPPQIRAGDGSERRP